MTEDLEVNSSDERTAVVSRCPKCFKYAMIMANDPIVIHESSDDILALVKLGYDIIHTTLDDAKDNFLCECNACATCGSFEQDMTKINGRLVCAMCVATAKPKKGK